MKINLSSIRSALHDCESFSSRSMDFVHSIEKELNGKIKIADIDDYDCDLKLIFIESGGSEMLFKRQMEKLKEPYYFLTSGEDNSLAATLEILTYLNSIGKKGEIIHGSTSYIASRIKELASSKAIKTLDEKRYGVIGEPSSWLISSVPDYNEVKRTLGATLIDIPLEELIEGFETVKEAEVDPLNFDKAEVAKANKVYLSLKGIISKYRLDGFTLRCFDLLSSIKTTGCLALAKLNQEGIIATCEGDIMAMLSMAIIKEVSGQSSFQANPSRINVEDNTVLFAHCTAPLDMLSSYKFDTHFESGIGVAIKGELYEKGVTIFKLSKDMNRYFVSKGTIVENQNNKNLCRTQILVKLEKDAKELLTNPCGNHHIICYGDYEKDIIDSIK